MTHVDLGSKFLEGSKDRGVLRVVINRPERKNACTIEMYHGIKKAAVLADKDPDDRHAAAHRSGRRVLRRR